MPSAASGTRPSGSPPPGTPASSTSSSIATSCPWGPAGPPRQVPSAALRTVHAGEPVTRWAGSLTDVAGVAAALAATLGDLHDAGLVHGRLDPSHVLLGDGGRPRLCGWSGPDGAAPADDVGAWGRLVDDLATRAASPRRLLAGRSAARTRRSLLDLAERASDPVPTRRPSARALADAVMTAVPGATLPSAEPPGAGPDRPARQDGLAPGARPDTLDRIWSYAGEPTEAERWAAAFGSEPDDDVVDDDADRQRPPPLPSADLEPLAWFDPGPFDLDDPGLDDPGLGDPASAGWARRDHDGDDASLPRTDDTPAAGIEAVGASDVAPGSPRRPWTQRPGSARARAGHPDGHDVLDLADAAPDRDDHAEPVDARTRDHVPVGSRASSPAPPPTVTERRRIPRAVLPVAAVLVMAGTAVTLIAGGSGGDADATRPPANPTPCPSVGGPAADVDGDGCPEALTVSGATVDAGVARWTLGEAGDLVAVGDWDCDGEATAALLRPTSGDVFLFSTWAALDAPVTVTPTRRVGGATAIRVEPVGASDAAAGGADATAATCDRLVVDSSDGIATVVAGPG